MKEMIKKTCYIFVIAMVFVLLDASVRGFADIRLISIRAMLFSFAYGVLFSSLSFVFKNRGMRTVFMAFVLLFFATYAFAQSMHFSFFSDFVSFTKLTNLKEFLVVKGETAKAFDWRYLIDYAIGIGAIVFTAVYPFEKKRDLKMVVAGILVFVLLFFGGKMTFRNEMDDPTQLYLTDDYLYSTLYNKKSAIERFGIYTFCQRDVVRIAQRSMGIVDQEEVNKINDYFDTHQRELKTNDKTGIFEGKNIVLILAESFNTWGIHEQITPNLYKMKNSGYYFENYYAPTFPSNTIDAEFAINTNLIPSMDFGNTAYMFSDNSYPQSLANLFRNEGYRTLSFHNSTGDFYNRHQYHEALGYEHFYDAEQMNIEIPSNFGYNWASDEELFEKGTDILLKETQGENFLAYMITVSTHTPYDENRTSLKDNLEMVKGIVDADSQVQYYLAASKQLDDGIGIMMDKLEAAGELENTVFVLFGDHYSYGMHHEIIWSYFTDYIYDFHRIHKVPFMIWTPDMEDSEMVSNPCSQFEVYPTVANLFGLKYDPTYTVGNDVFNDEENLIIYGSATAWQDSNVIYENNYIFEVMNEEADLSYIPQKNAEIIEKINLYQKVLEQNYFATNDFEERIAGE